MDTTQTFQTSEAQTENFGFHDFICDTNFEQFIDEIRGEIDDPVDNFYLNYDDGFMVNHGSIYNQFFPTTNDEEATAAFGFNSTSSTTYSDPDPNSILNLAPELCFDFIGMDDDNNDEGYSSETTQTTSMRGGKSGDTKKTLTSERKRRGRMKEKLYTLRSLVPNITKMDKASIIGDAVSYVQDLQMQSKKLKAEIAELESMKGIGKFQSRNRKPSQTQVLNSFRHQVHGKIVQMDVFQVEEGGFYARLVCNKSKGVAAALFRALESLTAFEIQNSNFATVSERFVLTFYIHVRESGQEMNLPILKLWLNGALLNQGFEYNTM